MAEEGKEADGRFKKGNLFSIGNNGGRPPRFETPEELFNKIAEYLDWEDQWKNPSAKGEGKGVYTLSGCALYLGYSSKASMDDQSNRGSEFSNVIERFKLFMTHWNEQKLYWGGTFAGSSYWLKNFGGYVDESTQNVKQTVTEVKVEVNRNSPPLEGLE
jgi:hypothetical protein